jgi:DNA-binding Xre family transcriptional regulator
MTEFNVAWSMWDEFVDNYPSMAQRVVDHYKSGKFELTLIFEDGSKSIYNSNSKAIRYMKQRDPNEVDETEYKMLFANVLNRKMNEKGITQKELAECTGLSKVSISGYIRCRSIPSSFAIYKLANALDCSVSELIDFDI